jgi:hypothetical protein
MKEEKIRELEKKLALDVIEKYPQIKVWEYIMQYEIGVTIFCRKCNEYVLSYGIDYNGRTFINVYGSCPHLKTYLHPKTQEIPEDVKNNGIKIVETDEDIAFIIPLEVSGR